MNSVVALSILADIQSGPVALETSREFKRLQTSSSVHNKLSMLETYPMGAMAWAKRLLKQAEKKGVQHFCLFFIGVGSHTSTFENRN